MWGVGLTMSNSNTDGPAIRVEPKEPSDVQQRMSIFMSRRMSKKAYNGERSLAPKINADRILRDRHCIGLNPNIHCGNQGVVCCLDH